MLDLIVLQFYLFLGGKNYYPNFAIESAETQND